MDNEADGGEGAIPGHPDGERAGVGRAEGGNAKVERGAKELTARSHRAGGAGERVGKGAMGEHGGAEGGGAGGGPDHGRHCSIQILESRGDVVNPFVDNGAFGRNGSDHSIYIYMLIQILNEQAP